LVGLQRSLFWRYRRRRGILAPLIALRRWDREALLVDRAYAEAAPERPELFVRATRALGLEWAAIDYSTLADGGVILWEANPYFTLPVGPKGPLARARRLGPRVDRLCAAMVLHLQQLVDGERRTGSGEQAAPLLPAVPVPSSPFPVPPT
jgi:hypothetical protein